MSPCSAGLAGIGAGERRTIGDGRMSAALPGTMGGMSIRRAVPVLTVPDVPAAVSEYRAILGVDVLMDHGWIATLGSPVPDSGPEPSAPAQFSVMSRDATAPCNPDLSIEVVDADAVDAAHAAALASGADIVHPPTDEPWGVRRFFYRAAGGHVVNVLAHR